MPTSKKRKPAKPTRTRSDIPLPPASLVSATLAVTQAALELVKEAEVVITKATREGDTEAIAQAVEVHHYLRTAGLGMLIAYSKQTGMPDPRDSGVLK